MQIITDSSCDLPKSYIDKYNILIVPLNIEINEENYVDGVNLSHEEFFKKMAESPTLPKTSQPSPQSYLDAFKEGAKRAKQMLSIHLSSKLSGTYDGALATKKMTGDNVEVFDSLSGSLGVGLQVLKACQMVEEGLELNKIVERLKEYREQMKVYVYLETLENAVKGGRVSRTKEMVASILNLRFVVHVEEGYVKVLKTLRGKKRAVSFMLEKLTAEKDDFKDRIIGITHCDCLEDAIALKDEIMKRFNPTDVIITTMGPVIGTHAGHGGLLVCF
ncbi:DegV family protein [Alkaliphilus peptidifermentans]|uniref:EDD domain protein, DegV family n=1 Tax=Alkaliphilus peptidifermentans DSM 18978 TaxID=1120976 RepID=A0A1G5CSD8_9FIRM|nr:DegV family protein [Alkaliphilus peptidifermentans]SCY05191.1 EDD domain protein, DegV family [Alkaliphilus peptidifermentans DSM 18978]